MTASRAEVIEALLALDTAEVPFSFAAFDDGVVGVWDYADAKWAGFFAAGTVEKGYTLTVTLHEEDSTYELLDRTSETKTRLSASGFSYSKTGFQGTTRQISMKKAWAPVASDHGQVGNTYGWNFDTDSMKKPVRDALEAAGWTERKKSFFAKLIGR